MHMFIQKSDFSPAHAGSDYQRSPRMKRKDFNILQDLRSVRWKFESTVLEENEA